MSKPDPPQPPDPIATGAAQTSTNVSTALANAFLNNTNQVTPQGKLSYDPTGNYTFTDPITNVAYNIPRFTATQTLSRPEQDVQDQLNQSKLNTATLAANQSGKLNSLLGSPLDTSGAPARGNASSLANVPGAATTFGDAGPITRSYGPQDNFSADRARTEAALYGRLSPQLEQDRARIEQRLADQGIRYGSPAYAAAMDDYNRQSTDARLAVTAAGGAEQQRMMDMAAKEAGFENAAQQQAYTEMQGRAAFSNQALGQNLNQAQAAFNAANTGRSQYMTESYAGRNQPINEITALISGSQVQQPNFVTTPSQQIPTTDYAGLINQNYAQQFGNYQQQSTNQNALLGGILGAGSNIGAAAFRYSDERLKNDKGRIGTVFAATPDGDRKPLDIHSFAYKDDPTATQHVGPMAQDVEKIDPGAVKRDRRGMRMIDTRRVMGGILKAA